ncbi:exopolysaccharide biosynthesis polyprenyl glycosylphosphotransferase [Rhodoblastus sp.]|uniref:exopolysaccharide biosynthesis polyprenyl glycosylphosphotransferase n=1 Tax=Rhodoblastus sp. TaxID=1962975 RepID=UPI0035B154D1
MVVIYCAIDLLFLIVFGLGPAQLTMGRDWTYLGQIDDQLQVIGLTTALYLLISKATGVYRARRILESGEPIWRLMLALGCTFLILTVIGAATKTTQNFSRIWFFSWVSLSCIVIPAIRLGLLAHMRKRLAGGDFVFRALSVGVFAKPLERADIDEASGGIAQVAAALQLETFAELEGLADWIARAEIDQIYIAAPWVDAPLILQRLLQLRQFSTEIFVLPDDARVHAHQLGVSVIGDRIALRAADRPINGWSLLAKRAQDVAVTSVALLFFAPVMALIALAIKLDSPGPLLFRQKRVGFNNGHFELLKFRSMYDSAADAHASRQTSRNDDRVTRVGRFIRRTSLDELPQLLNVLRGDMSIVGPRPHALLTKTNGVDLCDIADQYAARHRVKPGLTGLAQVNGYRGELDTEEKVRKRVEFDIIYIESWSTWLDIKIILRTALLMFFDRTAY